MALRDVYASGYDESNGKTLPADECPECTGSVVTDVGEARCADCGLVVEAARIDPGPEWRSFANDETNPVRTGAPLTPARHDRGLSTEIGFGNDADWSGFSRAKRRQLGRLRREHARARFETKAERNLATACAEIARLTSALDLPRSVREEASLLYRRAQTEDLILGRAIETIAAGSVYAAARCGPHTVTLDELASVAACSTQKLQLGYGVLNRELDLATPVRRPLDLIPKVASACDAPDAVRRRAADLVEVAQAAGLANGRHPGGVAAACLYRAGEEAGRAWTQAELAAIADVTDATLRARYEELLDVLDD